MMQVDEAPILIPDSVFVAGAAVALLAVALMLGLMGARINGTGFGYAGRKNYVTDGRLEEFDTIKWLTVVWLPVVPLKAVRVRRWCRGDFISTLATNLASDETIAVLGRRSWDFWQVAQVYAVVYLPLAVLAFLASLLGR